MKEVKVYQMTINGFESDFKVVSFDDYNLLKNKFDLILTAAKICDQTRCLSTFSELNEALKSIGEA